MIRIYGVYPHRLITEGNTVKRDMSCFFTEDLWDTFSFCKSSFQTIPWGFSINVTYFKCNFQYCERIRNSQMFINSWFKYSSWRLRSVSSACCGSQTGNRQMRHQLGERPQLWWFSITHRGEVLIVLLCVWCHPESLDILSMAVCVCVCVCVREREREREREDYTGCVA